MVVITELACLRCGHNWLPRISTKPVACPRCTSRIWDRPKLELRELKANE